MDIQFDQSIQRSQRFLIKAAGCFRLRPIGQNVVINGSDPCAGVFYRACELTDRGVVVLLFQINETFAAVSFLLIFIQFFLY